MLSLPDRPAVERAIATATDEQLARLLAERLALSIENGVADMTHYLVLQKADTEADIVGAVGFSPLVNPLDRTRFGSRHFQAWWDWLAYYDGWFEIIIAVGDTGFAYVILVPDVEHLQPELHALCRQHATAVPRNRSQATDERQIRRSTARRITSGDDPAHNTTEKALWPGTRR